MSRRPRNKRNQDHAKSNAAQGGGHVSRHGGSVPRKRGPHALPRTDAGRPRSATSAGKPVGGNPRRPTKRRPGGAPDRSQAQRPEPDRSQPRRPAQHERAASQDRSRKRETERDDRPRQPSYAEEAFVAEDSFSHDAAGYYLDDPPSSETELGIGTRVIPPAMNMAFDSSDDDAFTDLDGFDGSAFADTRPSTDSEMQATIQALEARLDGLIRQASEFTHDEDSDGAASAGPDSRASKAARGHGTDSREADEDDQSAVEATRELLSSEYYRRQWGRVGLRRRAEHIDDFGHDPVYERKLAPLLDFLCQHYFRCETQGVDNIPAEGRCLIVANHSGTLPLDGVMLRRAVRLRHPAKRELRWLAEDFIFYLPFVGVLMNRLGAVRACQENAQRLLMEESLVVAFPEGTKGVKKLFRQRYQLQRFGRGGYIRLCLRTGTPIVPCAIIGAEETNPLLFRLEQLPRLIGWPYLPVTPTFPLLGPLGLLPAPTKWKMIFGEPLDFGQYGPADANDHVLVGRLSEQVQAAIRDMLARGLAERNGVWLG
ncbi:MAG TPA: 1-acyl-sn-glycerol-3-phosphate acyltransferase [Polyangiaceae bacterium]|nr:1-acyl-sn-glycerol-3-phosphate acyltransferase [Polyangiaceae bacterium]